MPRSSPIIFISLAAISHEILLIKLLSIIQTSTFVAIVISLALLGYASSGTFLAITFKKRNFYSTNFLINTFLFSITIPTSYLIVEQIPTNIDLIPWDLMQLVYLTTTYLILSLPFFFAANCIGILYMDNPQKSHLTYGFDLSGAGIGAITIIILLNYFSSVQALYITSIFPILAAITFLGIEHIKISSITWIVILILITSSIYLFNQNHQLKISNFKDLSQILRSPNAQILFERWTPAERIDVVNPGTIPLRYAPGLATNFKGKIPKQLAILFNGDKLSPICTENNNMELFYDNLPTALAYHLTPHPNVIVFGIGGGMDISQAINLNAESVIAIDGNPFKPQVLVSDLAKESDNFFSNSKIKYITGELRTFLAQSKNQFDLINISFPHKQLSASAGGLGDTGNYIYTVEALEQYLAKLSDKGMIQIHFFSSYPPQKILRLFLTAIKALQKSNRKSPTQHLIIIRSLQTTVLIIKNKIATIKDLDITKQFCIKRSFDLIYAGNDTNIPPSNITPAITPIIQRVLSDSNFLKNYKYNLFPTTDNQPSFDNFIKLDTFFESLKKKSKGGAGLINWRLPILWITLIIATISGVICVIIPLLIFKHNQGTISSTAKLTFFFLLGLGFMMIEISYINKMALYWGNPILSSSIVLSTFLIFSGFGGIYSKNLRNKKNKAILIFLMIPISIIISILGLDTLLYLSIDKTTLVKLSITIFSISILAFPAGIPFPLVIGKTKAQDDKLIPWFWGINGFASVISPIIAHILITESGHHFNLTIAGAIYIIAIILFRKFTD